MKCQKCEKPATFHITELTGDEVMALHFCAECAEKYLKPAESQDDPAPSIAGVFGGPLKLSQKTEELAKLDQRKCPVCGITFFEFRQAGRLGCPHDYVCFEKQLVSLLESIHGVVVHNGKKPKHGIQDPERQTELIRLRRQMREAVENEEYEAASQLRDQIRTIEGKS